jgi:hypothetical protein
MEDHSDLDEVFREAIFQDNTAQLNMRLPLGDRLGDRLYPSCLTR